MAVKFGMTVAQIIGQLTRGFMKAMGRKPDGLEKIKIQQEAVQRFKDMNKVVDMEGNVIDTSKGIMGGFQVGQKGIFDNIFARMQSQIGKNIKEVKTKNKPDVYDLDDYDTTNMSEIQKEIIRTETKLGNLNPESKGFRKAAKELGDKIIALKNKLRDDKAMGGRIGYKDGPKEGEGVMKMVSMDENEREFMRLVEEFMERGFSQQEAIEAAREEFDRKAIATGGRIGLKEGKGIMQMASVDDPFYRDSEGDRDEHSFRMFNKPYKELNEFELEEFQEEMMRLMNKFSSAPDPMDERNMVMESIAREEFGRPLKDLDENQIRQIEEMMMEMDIPYDAKKDRGAPSITLADGGRAAFKEGLRAKLMKPFKIDRGTLRSMFFNKNNPIITGLNTSTLFDTILPLISSGTPFADGGRAAFKDGPEKPSRRTFMKIAGGIASMLPFGIGKVSKVAAPAVAKAAEITGPALAKIVETVMSLGKLVSVQGKRVKEMVTKKKHQGVEVTEDIQDGSYVIKKGDKEIYYKPGRQDESGGFDDDIIEVIEKRIEKAGGGGIGYMLGE